MTAFVTTSLWLCFAVVFARKLCDNVVVRKDSKSEEELLMILVSLMVDLIPIIHAKSRSRVKSAPKNKDI